MSNSATVELITDAVVDAVRAALPGLVREANDAVSADIRAEIEQLERDHVATCERIADVRNALAVEVARTDDLTASAREQLAQLAERIGAELEHRLRAAVARLPPPPAGERGAAGRDGRDATFKEPVLWTQGDCVARGAVIQHRGALWFAHVDTNREPGTVLSGYTLIVDAAIPRAIEADETGELFLRIEYASGAVERLPFGFRPLTYVGVWDADRDYYPNQCVTCKGSVWTARERSRDLKPGTDEGARAWLLSVKCGRDGRDADASASKRKSASAAVLS